MGVSKQQQEHYKRLASRWNKPEAERKNTSYQRRK